MDKNTQSVGTSQSGDRLITVILTVILMMLVIVSGVIMINRDKNIKIINGMREDVAVLRSYILAMDAADIRRDEMVLSEHPVDVSNLGYWDHDWDPDTPPQLEKIYAINPSTVSEIISRLNYPLEYYMVSDLRGIYPDHTSILEKYK